MAEQRVGSRGRRMGSSRRRQLRRDAGEEPPWAAAVMQRVQEVVQEQRGDTEGFVTRADMQKLQEEVIPCSTEELELLFDGMDAAGSGQLRTEEFTAGLRQFLSSQKVSKEHRRRKTASRRSCLVLASPTWEGTDSEEKKHFAAFMEQLGVDDRWEEQEIWQLWAKLRKDEPQLLGNLEDFLAKMRHRIQEARSKKEALEEALNKRVAEHNQEVQQLCEALEQQIQEERQRMEQESTARSRLHCAVLQRALDARDREVQRLVAAQEELEAQCHSLSSTQRAASAENRQLEENNRALEEQLQHIHAQLQQTHECLRAARAQQRAEEPRDGVEAELPGETPPSLQVLQMSPEQHRSEMGVRLGYHGSEPKRRSTHHVVWEKPAADTNTSRLLSVEEDPFPEFLKEEQFSGQGSLLREMSDAIAALSTQKLQAPGDAAHCPHDDAEPQTGPPGSAPRETHISHEGLEEDLREGRAAAELRAGDGTQAGASAGAQEEGAAQGDSVEGAGQSLEQMERVLSVQGRGAGGEQQVLKEAESPQEALGDSTEMGEQARVGVEGEGWVQGKMKWEKVQLPGEGENMEAVLKAQKVELPVGGSAADVLWVQGEQLELEVPRWVEVQTAAVQGVTEAPNPEKVDGEGSGTVGHCWGEMEGTELQPLSVDGDLGTEQAENIRPDVQLVEEADRAEPELEEGAGAAAVLGEGLSPAEIPAGSPAGGLVLVSAQGLEMEEAEDSPEESLLHGIPSPEASRDGLDDTAIHVREDAEDGGQELAEPGLLNQPVCELQESGDGQAEGAAAELSPQEKAVSLEPLEGLSGDTHVQLIAELGEMEESLEAALQPTVAGDLGTEQAENIGPDVQLVEEADRAEPELEEGAGAAAVLGEGLSPAEIAAGSPAGGLVLVSAQGLEMEEAEGSPAESLLHGIPSPEASRDGLDDTAAHLREDAEDGGQELAEPGLLNQPLCELQGEEARQAQWAAAELQPQEESGSLKVLEALSGDTHVQLIAELGEMEESLETELQPLSVAGDLGTEQAENVGPDVQLVEEADRAELQPLYLGHQPRSEQAESMGPEVQLVGEVGKPELVEIEGEEDSQVDVQLQWGPSQEVPLGGGGHTAVQLTQEVEDEGQDVEHLKEERGMEVVQEEGTGKDELVLVSAQGLEMEEAEGSPAESLLHGIPSPEASRDGLDDTAIHVREDAEDGGQELAEPGLLSQPLCELQGEEARHAEGAAAELSPQEKAVSLELLEGLSGDTHVQLIAELGEMEESLEAALQPLNVAGDLGTEQAENMGPDMQLVEEADRAEPELEEGAGAAAVLGEGLSPAEIAAGSPAGGLVLVSAQELEGKETESLVQLEELTLPYGDSTGADGKPLCSVGLWEVAENPAVGLEAAPCMADNTDVWNRNVEPILHPEYAAAAGHAHPAAGLVAASGPELQILEETQRERADAEGRPLDGARGLEVVQGARLEAEARISVAAQHLELKQGRDASAATLASPVSEVPLQISTLNLDVMMQEDVLIPDVQLVGGSGQAAQRQLQEQVSAQADKGRLHAAPQQPQKPPGVMEAEQAAAGPAETPKQEVPPASALHTGIQQGGDAAEDLSGMALGDSPLVEAVSSMVELSGGQREELNVEKKQEMEQKMSLGGKPSPGEPEAVTVNGAEAAPKDSVEPDHLYNVLFVGDSNVGKTSFLYRLHADTFNPHLAATVGLDYQVKNLMVDNRHFALRMWDSAGQERYHSVTKQFFRKADGVVLMYDITSQYSFADVRYWLSCIQEGAEDGITVLLLGNKTDCAAERQVPTQEGERLAQEHQLLFYECSAASGHNVIESIVSLVRALKVCEDQLRNKAEEVPKVPQKKKGCCW
ncbi:ras-related protein Rab-44 isoform X6 [Gallus gallus]|uniref:ras-related protein Rab-44 isoform X6 n=1 Tax=Gallus gallus TaxID=9031 RepID=UPI001AE83BCA|nr:ras-related protein Rab-44 isoform X6 [Gallus gallus]